MKKLLYSTFAFCALSSVGSAAIISINFTRGASSSTDIAAADSAGVESATNWINLRATTTSASNLELDSGVMSVAGFTRGGSNRSGWNGGAVNEIGPNNRLMSDYVDVFGDPTTWTFTGIVATAATYDVIVYTASGSNGGRFGDYTIGGTTIRSTDVATFDSAGPGFVESTGTSGVSTNGNYVRFTGLTGSSFTLSAVGANATTPRGPVSGIQIIGVEAAAVPEPTSFALLGLGGLGLFIRRRK